MRKPSIASFFAGIGGFDLGFERAGFKVEFLCEVDPFCQQILSKHWPKTPLLKDISDAKATDIPEVDVWCGGFPCQDLSVARGSLERHGLSGKRSGLFFKLAELAKSKKPRVLLLENVHGLLNANHGKDFAELLYTFNRLGYGVSWRVLNSRYFGVPQSRPRVYICAWLGDPVSAGNALFEADLPSLPPAEVSAFLQSGTSANGGVFVPKLAFCLAATSGRHTGTDWSRTYVSYLNAVRRMTPLECERLQGFPDDWTLLSIPKTGDAERVDSLRYHALGNAVSVPIIAWIAGRIRKQLSAKIIAKAHPDWENPTRIPARWAGLTGQKVVLGRLQRALKEDLTTVKWRSAGLLWKGVYVSNHVPPAPQAQVNSDLIDIIEKVRPHDRYFLSSNAAEGILRRVDHQKRKLFSGLRAALERLSNRQLVDPAEPTRTSESDRQLIEQQCVLP